MNVLTAPRAPGRLGQPIDPSAAAGYLLALGEWRDSRKKELDDLDAAALKSARADELSRDMQLSMALWKAVADRYELLMATWDSGRVGAVERERLAALIWGSMDAAGDLSSQFSVSLPEACRLSDALAGQLRVRLSLDPAAGRSAERIRDLRAQLERIRDQVGLEPVNARDRAEASLAKLHRRVDEVADKHQRGGDVGGLLGPLEVDAATMERDLIVGAANRHKARDLVLRARETRADLLNTEAALRQLVRQCVQTVTPAPKYAVPDVEAIGPVPNTEAALQPYLNRLEQVGRAMALAQKAYSEGLATHGQLVGRLEGYRAKAEALGLSADPDLGRIADFADEVLARRPSPLSLATGLVDLYQAHLALLQDTRPASSTQKVSAP